MEFTGAMSSLLPKLGELLLEEYKLKDSVKKGIRELKAELESMEAALVKVSSVPLDQLDSQVKIWANEVRELSYAIEDSLDSFVTHVESVEPTKPKIKNLLKKARNMFTKFKARHEIADDIKDIESKVRKIKERYDRYKINDIVANHATTTVDPRLSAMYNKVSDLVGTDEPIEELTKVLSKGVDTSQKNLKIVSIVGFGGLGKTTLAKALYDKLSKTYQCQGFVPVGQNPDTKKVLRDILLELDRESYRYAATMDEWQLINQLQKFLAGKRFFIVIDDIWDIRTWKTIKCAFMDSHPESRIIITTRDVDVAKRTGGIYCMKPLSDENSKMLFYTRTCGEGVSEDSQPAEVTNKILKKCGGVPLAIITIASLLVGKITEDWSKVYDAIGFGHEDNDDVHNTRKILSFSYYDLPSHLKTCLLYLSIFPEDFFIEKNSLIWRWVIEGFVPGREGIGFFEQGEICFNDLVNKSMIRWIEPDKTRKIGAGGCRVHDMVLDLIRAMSNDVNFVTVDDMEHRRKKDDMEQHGTCSRDKRINMVRRLALHGSSAEHKCSIEMEHVRSFNAITCTGSGIAPLSVFKVLRVLVIEECDFLEGHGLKHLGKLVQLRYLGLVRTTVELPDGIGHDLKFLEVLDVRGGDISELPPSVGELTNLKCLWANRGTIMKGKVGKLTCLEELQLYSVDESPNFFTELGKLTNLRVLEFQFDEFEETTGKALAESVCNLHKIQRLTIWRDDFVEKELYVRGGSLEDMAPSSRLCSFLLNVVIIPRMPSWIDSLRVPLLYELWLYVEVVEARDLQALGRLPSLLELFLESQEEKRISYTFGSDEFQKLKVLMTNIEITVGEGALPRLEELTYSASAGRKDSLVPWSDDSCPLLEDVVCRLDCAYSGDNEVCAAEAVQSKAVRTHPNLNGSRNRYNWRQLYIDRKNYDGKTARFIDALGEEITADDWRLRGMIESLETLLRVAAEPRVGRYGEQELRGFVTKFKSLLEEEPDHSDDDAPSTPTPSGNP